MPGLSHTLDVARRALAAQQSVISVLGHNVANANTKGYTRQVAHLSSVAASSWGTDSFGNGVEMDSVIRQRDNSLDNELRRDKGDLGFWDTRARRLSRLEVIVNEPSEGGLGATMDAFWTSWMDLANDPSDITRVANTRAQGEIMAYRFNTLIGQVEQVGRDIDTEVITRVDEYNLALSEIKGLNTMIRQSVLRGLTPNDLLDRRDLILDTLSELGGINYGTRDDGTVFIRLGSILILDDTTHRPLQAVVESDDDGYESVRLELSMIGEVEMENGIIGGLLQMRQETIPEFNDKIDTLAMGIKEQVNLLHHSGPSMVNFFEGESAAEMHLAPEIAGNMNLINTSTTGLDGDNDIALAIGAIRNGKILNSNSSTPNEFWNSTVGQIGIVNREATFQKEGLELTTQALSEQRDSISGVSLDDEMGNIIIAQQSYMAAVKLFEISGLLMDALMAI